MTATISRFPLTPRIPALIFLNGPAGSGKSTLADYLCSLDRGMTQYHHATPLWSLADILLGIGDAIDPQDDPLHWSYSEPEVKSRLIRPGYSVRQLLIDLGQFVRTKLGPEYLSEIASRETHQMLLEFDTVIFPAVRTLEDVSRLIPGAGAENCLLLRLSREGCSWTGDLGSYIDLPGVRTVDIENNFSFDDLYARVLAEIGVSV